MCYYVEVSPEGMTAAGGWKFDHPVDQVERFRAAVDRGELGQAFEKSRPTFAETILNWLETRSRRLRKDIPPITPESSGSAIRPYVGSAERLISPLVARITGRL